MKKYLCYLLLPLLLASCLSESTESSDDRALTVGDTIPTFRICNESGCTQTQDLKGKISLIFFFNSDCGDCRQVFPEVENLYRHYQSDPDFILLAIAREQTEKEVASYFQQHNYTLPFYADKDRSVYQKFAASIVPRFFLSNSLGIIQYTASENPDITELKKNIDRLIAEKQSN